MSECPGFDYLIVVPRLRIQNANAISSPLTHGFPSITAFLGLMWALERKTAAAGLDICFNAVGVVCHDYEEQITDDSFVKAFRLTRNPIDKDGGTAAIVEEGRIHLDISLVFAVTSDALAAAEQAGPAAKEAIAAQVRDILGQMRVAGGSVVPSRAPLARQKAYVVQMGGDATDRQETFSREMLKLLPGFALIERSDLLEARHQAMLAQNPGSTRLDAWLSLSRINWHYTAPVEGDDKDKGGWTHDRKGLGWVVPIPVGYGVLSGPHSAGSVANARDASVPFCFVESLYSVGQWLSPHRLQSPEQLLWYANSQPQDGLYRCRNDYRVPQMYAYDAD
ncbi:type I-F CRISPR-associated protein Csy2 [Uliginosibacterium sp. sgz301328]|uniref:type I-F CRISPR-associated protein Csy2 n=1 Tax=Uliginosibacterium sp. sgz301328 TaxID=3243764 RepID=UPI00359ED2FC